MKKLITEEDVRKVLKTGSKVVVTGSNAIITPLARDLIRSKNLAVIEKKFDDDSAGRKNFPFKKIAVGSDHTGFKTKNSLIKLLTGKDYQVYDVGTFDEKSCDYPDFALAVSEKVQQNSVDCGIIIDATGIPSAIAANKVEGIRAATCYNEFSAKSSRAHNDANILVLGAKALGDETIFSIVETWLNTAFEGGRHQRRLNKITGIEKKYRN